MSKGKEEKAPRSDTNKTFDEYRQIIRHLKKKVRQLTDRLEEVQTEKGEGEKEKEVKKEGKESKVKARKRKDMIQKLMGLGSPVKIEGEMSPQMLMQSIANSGKERGRRKWGVKKLHKV